MTKTPFKLLSLALALLPAFAQATFLTVPASIGTHPANQNPVEVATDCQHTPTLFRCVKFLYNHDGDTLTVSIPDVHPLFGQKVSVRIFGVDTPELYSRDACEHEAALVAQKFVRAMLLRGKKLELHKVQRDKYFRILADVRVDDVSVSQELITRGLAYPYFGGTKQTIDWCPARSVIID